MKQRVSLNAPVHTLLNQRPANPFQISHRPLSNADLRIYLCVDFYRALGQLGCPHGPIVRSFHIRRFEPAGSLEGYTEVCGTKHTAGPQLARVPNLVRTVVCMCPTWGCRGLFGRNKVLLMILLHLLATAAVVGARISRGGWRDFGCSAFICEEINGQENAAK